MSERLIVFRDTNWASVWRHEQVFPLTWFRQQDEPPPGRCTARREPFFTEQTKFNETTTLKWRRVIR